MIHQQLKFQRAEPRNDAWVLQHEALLLGHLVLAGLQRVLSPTSQLGRALCVLAEPLRQVLPMVNGSGECDEMHRNFASLLDASAEAAVFAGEAAQLLLCSSDTSGA